MYEGYFGMSTNISNTNKMEEYIIHSILPMFVVGLTKNVDKYEIETTSIRYRNGNFGFNRFCMNGNRYIANRIPYDTDNCIFIYYMISYGCIEIYVIYANNKKCDVYYCYDSNYWFEF